MMQVGSDSLELGVDDVVDMMMQVGSASVELGVGDVDVELGQVAGIDQSGSATSPGRQQRQQLARSLWATGFLTLVTSAGTFLHKQDHAVLYDITLACIFVAGVIEVWTAFWVSQAHDDGDGGGGRPCTFGRAVLLASVIPLATVVGLGGYPLFKVEVAVKAPQ
ncbi:hypothetical protein ABZP36_017490 [Zizania latifolia]